MDPDADVAACVTDHSFELDDHTDELHADDASPEGGAPLPPGTRLQNRYVLEDVIGAGGMGIVHGAMDLGPQGNSASGTPIAIKMVRPQWRLRPDATARLKLEFRRMVTLDHPAIVRIFDLECDRDTWFITMERLRGETLQRALQRNRATAAGLRNAPAIADACISALAHAHGRGVVHGDVKPGNIFLAEDDSVRLLDFGAGAKIGADFVRVVATRAYASPQVLAGMDATAADDIFSLSCVIYEMTTGRHPFSRCASTAARNAGLVVAMPPNLTDAAWQRLRNGMAWERGDRPNDIRRLPGTSTQGERPAMAPPSPMDATPGPRPLPRSVRARRPSLVLLGLASSLAAAAWIMPRLGVPQPTAAQIDTERGIVSSAAPVSAVSPTIAGEPAMAREAKLTGEGMRSGVPVGFDSSSMSVSEGTLVAALTLRRLDGSSRRADVTWAISRGPTTPGVDFAGPLTGTATLASGQSRRVIYIPIIDDTESERTETFVVRLDATQTSRVLASSARIAVSIVDND